MAQWKCSICGWVYDPAQGDPENHISPGTEIEDLPDDWGCPICGSGKQFFEPVGWVQKARFDQDKLILDDRAQRLLSDSLTIYKERFENLFRVAQKLTSSLNIGEILERIRDEARGKPPS